MSIHPFIQAAHLQLGVTTAAISEYTLKYWFEGLVENDNISDNDMVESIVGRINTHMANLSVHTTTLIKANATQLHVSIQQLAAHITQLQQQQQAMMQKMVMLTMALQQQHVPKHYMKTHVSSCITQQVTKPPHTSMKLGQGAST